MHVASQQLGQWDAVVLQRGKAPSQSCHPQRHEGQYEKLVSEHCFCWFGVESWPISGAGELALAANTWA